MLRDQQQQQHQQHSDQTTGDGGTATSEACVATNGTDATKPNDAAASTSTTIAATGTTTLDKKLRFRSKSKDCVERLFSEKYAQVGELAQQQQPLPAAVQQPPLHSGGGRLMFVCSKTRDVTSCLGYDSDYGECSAGGGGIASGSIGPTSTTGSTQRRSVRMRAKSVVKRAASKLSFRDNLNNNSLSEKTIVCDKMMVMTGGSGNGQVATEAGKATGMGMKSTYSEPALSVGGAETVMGQSRRHRHRRRRERNRSQRFGYEIRNVDDFLSKVSAIRQSNRVHIII